MKRFTKCLLVLLVVGTIALAGCVAAPVNYPNAGEGYAAAAGEPWIGAGTPWVYWNNWWWYNGFPYFLYSGYGWYPYGTYSSSLIVRNYYWYNPTWQNWYNMNPQYYRDFHHKYGAQLSHHSNMVRQGGAYPRMPRATTSTYQRGIVTSPSRLPSTTVPRTTVSPTYRRPSYSTPRTTISPTYRAPSRTTVSPTYRAPRTTVSPTYRPSRTYTRPSGSSTKSKSYRKY